MKEIERQRETLNNKALKRDAIVPCTSAIKTERNTTI